MSRCIVVPSAFTVGVAISFRMGVDLLSIYLGSSLGFGWCDVQRPDGKHRVVF